MLKKKTKEKNKTKETKRTKQKKTKENKRKKKTIEMRTKVPYYLTTKAYPFEPQRNDECSIHAFNNIVALTTSKEFAEKRRDLTIKPMNTELSTEACRLAKAAFPEFRNDTYAVCSAAEIPRNASNEEKKLMRVEKSHRVQTVFMFYEIWNLCNPEMPCLRTTEPMTHDSTMKTDDETGLEVARMFDDIHVIGAQVCVIVLGTAEHYVAIVRMDEGFVLVDSMTNKTDKPRVGKVKGLRHVTLRERRMPYVSSASDIHGMVMALYPDMQNTNPDSKDLRRMYPYKPDYYFVFTESPDTMPWYRAYIEKPIYADTAFYMMPDKGILKAIADSMKRCLYTYTDVDSAAEFVGDLKARMNIDAEIDETDTESLATSKPVANTPPKQIRKRKSVSPKSTKKVVTKVKRDARSEDEDLQRALAQSKQEFDEWALDRLDNGETLSKQDQLIFGILSFGQIIGLATAGR